MCIVKHLDKIKKIKITQHSIIEWEPLYTLGTVISNLLFSVCVNFFSLSIQIYRIISFLIKFWSYFTYFEYIGFCFVFTSQASVSILPHHQIFNHPIFLMHSTPSHGSVLIHLTPLLEICAILKVFIL